MTLRRSPALAALALAVAGCGGERREGERLVRAYDEAIVAAYRANDPSPLAAVATPKEQRKVAALLDLKKASGVVLEATLEALEVTEVKRPAPDALVVSTQERWRYFDRPLQPGAPPGRVVVVRTALEYAFVRGDGAWRMDEARTLSTVHLDADQK